MHNLDSIPDILQILHQIPAFPALCTDILDLKGKRPAVVFREKEFRKIVVPHSLLYPVLAEPGAYLTDIHAHRMLKELFPFDNLGIHLPFKQRAVQVISEIGNFYIIKHIPPFLIQLMAN